MLQLAPSPNLSALSRSHQVLRKFVGGLAGLRTWRPGFERRVIWQIIIASRYIANIEHLAIITSIALHHVFNRTGPPSVASKSFEL